MKEIFSVNSVTAGYGKCAVLKNISFTINKGDFLGIIGPNGSGKSTLLRAMTRILLPMGGNVYFEGEDISNLSLKALAQKAAFVPQDTLITFDFSVLEIVLMGRTPYLTKMANETKEDYKIALESLRITGCEHLADRPINELSAGERQLVIIARALTQKPVALFLDEPTAHLDICHQVQIFDLLRHLNEEKGLTIVTVLHDLNLAAEYCTKLILLKEGRLYKEGAPPEILEYKTIEEVYKTPVVTSKNPISGKPFILLIGDKEIR